VSFFSQFYLHFFFTFTLLPGTEFIDTVTIAPGVVIPRQSIGVATELVSSKRFFFSADGILGFARTSS
jgi:hypothetical protein